MGKRQEISLLARLFEKSVSTFRGELCHLKVSITKMATEIRVVPLFLLKISNGSPVLSGKVQKS